MKTTDEIRMIWDTIRFDLSHMDTEEKVYWITSFIYDVFDEEDLPEMLEMITEEMNYLAS